MPTEVSKSRIHEGLPYPKGATWDGLGVNFALFSAHATKVELCLFGVVLPRFQATSWSCSARNEMPHKNQPCESREFALRDPVKAGLAGSLCTQQTQLSDSSDWPGFSSGSLGAGRAVVFQ